MSTQTEGSSTASPSTPEARDGKRRWCDRDGSGCQHRGRHCGRKAFVVLGIVLLAGLAGAFIGKSWAHGGPAFPGGPHAVMSGDPARMDEGIERMVRRFAGRTDATPEQQQKLTAIAKDAAHDIAPLRDKLKAARSQAVALLKAPAVDRAAIERLRSEQLQLADTVSQRLTRAMGDAAEVLTPAQREKVAGRMAEWIERSEHHGRWFGGMPQQGGTPAPAAKDPAKTV